MIQSDPTTPAPIVSHYHQKLQGTDWDHVVRVQHESERVTVSVLRQGEAIRGLFVIVSENNELVLVNVVCDLAPDRVRQLAHRVTTVGMEFGLDKVLQDALQEMERELH